MPSDVELLLGMKSAQNTFARALAYNEKEFLTQVSKTAGPPGWGLGTGSKS